MTPPKTGRGPLLEDVIINYKELYEMKTEKDIKFLDRIDGRTLNQIQAVLDELKIKYGPSARMHFSRGIFGHVSKITSYGNREMKEKT